MGGLCLLCDPCQHCCYSELHCSSAASTTSWRPIQIGLGFGIAGIRISIDSDSEFT